MTSKASGTTIASNREVRLDVPLKDDADAAAIESEKETRKKSGIPWNPQKWEWPDFLSWVPGQLNWQGLKPVIRCSIASWISFILLFCNATENVAGQAAFLYMVVGFIQPPADPIVPTFVRSVYNLLFVCAGWAASVIAQAISWRLRGYPAQANAVEQLQRMGYDCGSSTSDECLQSAIFQGQFLEIGPIVIHAVFLGIAEAIVLWIKLKYKQHIYSCVFATICLVITMSYGPLFPYFDGTLGLLIVVPRIISCFSIKYLVGIQSAINFGCACFIFPQTVSHKYTQSLISVLNLIKSGIAEQKVLLAISPINFDEWVKYKTIQEQVQKGKSIFVNMIPMEEFLTKEFCYSRIKGEELIQLKGRVRQLLSGMGGFYYWYYSIESKIYVYMESRPTTPASSTPMGSQVSLNINEHLESSSHSRSRSHLSLPHLAALNRHYEPVGVLECQAYSDLEANLQHSLKENPSQYEDMIQATNSTCIDLLAECERGMSTAIKWLESVNSDRVYARVLEGRKKAEERRDVSVQLEETLERLKNEIEQFQGLKRLGVLEPHLRWFESEPHKHRQPSYRLLFQSFFYQFHLLEFANSLLSTLLDLHDQDRGQHRPRWWFPGFLEVSKWLVRGGDSNKSSDEDLGGEDQDPEDITQIHTPEHEEPLQVQKRNPDAYPPTNVGHLIGRAVVRFFKLLTRPDVFFAIKAGIITVLIATPAYSKSTAEWWYENRGIWVVILAALTISLFTADTIFGFVMRIFGTFLGTIFGMAIWYTGSGNGTGNPYGLGAVLAVVLPFLLFFRINFLYITPMPAIIFCVTIALIVGYSWHDTHYTSPTVLGYGFSVAWRRFLAVSAGITVGLIGSLIPKPISGRSMIRATCSRTITEIGQLHTDIQEYAAQCVHGPQDTHGKSEDAVAQRVVFISVKLNATQNQIAMQKFEPPLQGPWPAFLYSDLVALQIELIELYTSFHSLLRQLEPVWTEALLTRTGWLDVHSVADHFAVIYMCANATKTGNALPQITPSPLVDRFYTRLEGLRVAGVNQKGILDVVDHETLQDWQYALYAIGCSLAFAICYRLDRLMMITKALVGEVYQIEHWKSRQRLYHPQIPAQLQHIYSTGYPKSKNK